LIPGLPPAGEPRPRRRPLLSLRSRLLLLVIASVLPLIGMGVFREYSNYRVQRHQVDESLQTAAQGLAVAVERDLQARIMALETLATSPTLLSDDLPRFDQQARAFLSRQAPGVRLGVAGPDAAPVRLYGPPVRAGTGQVSRDAVARVFTMARPLVTDLGGADDPEEAGFSVNVPVFRDGKIVHVLSLQLPPQEMAALVDRQHLPPRTLLAVVDSAGVIVARVPEGDRFIGSHVVPAVWTAMQANPEGLVAAPTLEGIPAVVAYTRIAPFGWYVGVAAPEDALFAPLRTAMIHVAASGVIVLLAGLTLARFAARHITRPIAYLRLLAADSDRADGPLPQSTGLPETDTVARALLAAAAERRDAARALAESEQRFRALFERSSSGTVLLDPDTTEIIDANEAAAAIVGYTVKDFRGCRMTEFRLGRTVEDILQTCRAVVAGQTLHYEAQVTGRNGPRDLLIAAAPL
jgi:PAS domain-containing protein